MFYTDEKDFKIKQSRKIFKRRLVVGILAISSLIYFCIHYEVRDRVHVHMCEEYIRQNTDKHHRETMEKINLHLEETKGLLTGQTEINLREIVSLKQ
jgi:hypothetical protein